ncbi:MAG: alpha/beta fold hydrolase [Burkholderiaceae bacterium]|jgi:alpha/beta superfamily hydrolase|nr:alpha/beta fold hydrolase [Burkholderiaceae bacterium]
MNASRQTLALRGPVGALEALLDLPDALPPPDARLGGQPPRGTAVIAHPHPLFGGTMNNKVVSTLARAFARSGWRAVRFNFRGVGASAGSYDEGAGELLDLLAVIEQTATGGQPLALAGFSFGAFVAARAAQRLFAEEAAAATQPFSLASLVLAGTAAARFDVPPVPAHLHALTLVVHGEQDDTVPLADVMNWARPQSLAVTVVPGGGHFFHGQLPLLRGLVERHLRGAWDGRCAMPDPLAG